MLREEREPDAIEAALAVAALGRVGELVAHFGELAVEFLLSPEEIRRADDVIIQALAAGIDPSAINALLIGWPVTVRQPDLTPTVVSKPR